MPDDATTTSKDDERKIEDAKLSAEQVAQVRETFGLKEGQTVADMVTGATKRVVGEALGIKPGETVKDAFTGIVQSMLDVKKTNAAAAPSGDTSDNGAAKITAEDQKLRGDFQDMKTIVEKLHAESTEARETVVVERRRTAIRDAMGKHDTRPEISNMLLTVFDRKLEGPPLDFDDEGRLVAKLSNGSVQPADAYFTEYFRSNPWALKQFTAAGSGARSGRGGTQTPEFDTAKAFERDGGGFDGAYQEDADGTLKTLEEANAAKRAAIGI